MADKEPVTSNPDYEALDAMITSQSTKRVRVTRVLVYEGSPLWVKSTLERSWVQGDAQRHLPNGSIVEASITKIEEVS